MFSELIILLVLTFMDPITGEEVELPYQMASEEECIKVGKAIVHDYNELIATEEWNRDGKEPVLLSAQCMETEVFRKGA